MRENLSKPLFILLVIALFVFLLFVFYSNDNREEAEGKSPEIQVVESDDGKNLSEYFEDKEMRSKDTITTQGDCLINGELVENGISNSQTVCVIIPPKK